MTVRRQAAGKKQAADEQAGSQQASAVVLDKAARENFPVAPFFMPAAMREGLMAVYGFARLVDDTGDGDLEDPAATAAVLGSADAGALAMLDALEADLDRVFETVLGTPGAEAPRHPLLADLVPVADRHALTPEPFRALIQANRVDQTVSRYADIDALMGYCELSANPVGLMVLQLAGRATPERVRQSDAVCSALQIIEHLQDVAEDRARDRIYLPAADMAAFEVTEADLDADHAGPALRALVGFEAQRARVLMDQGAPLVGTVGGRLRLLLAGFAAGGYAALDAIAAVDNDVLAGAPKPRKRRLLREAAATLVRGR